MACDEKCLDAPDGAREDMATEASRLTGAEEALTTSEAAAPAGASDLEAPSGMAESPASEPELPLEERVANLERAVTRHPLHREILYRTLAFCERRRELTAIETEIASYPEFRRAVQDQYHLIQTLEHAGGLTRTPLDAEGVDVTPERLAGLTQDEADDLIATYAFATTDAGRAFVERHAPKARLVELMGLVPERKDTYVELMAFIEEEPRTYADICALLKDRPALVRTTPDGELQTMQPSVFLDKLEEAGGVEWSDGWVLTDEGRQFLDELDRL